MNLLDLTFPTPAENLACDEALLDACEREGAGEILRFWEPADYFVVVGYANHVGTEANTTACAAERIPVLRRCSGGGTVLQGPGCLNYSLILKLNSHDQLKNIPSANRFIMERNCAALNTLLSSGRSHTASIDGCTDLVIAGRKFSGNSQRRRRHCLLFHGTFLLKFDIALMEKLLSMPSKQPAYREQRSHRDFLMNLTVSVAEVKRALREAWNALQPLETIPHETISTLVRDKYATAEWNLKF
jgi:lipoate-protein ligase A